MTGWISKLAEYSGKSGWFSKVGEFTASFYAHYTAHKAKIDAQRRFAKLEDVQLSSFQGAKTALEGSDCFPIVESQVTKKGAKLIQKALLNHDEFGANLALDANPGINKKQVCIAMLKQLITVACSENVSTVIRSATYQYFYYI